MKPENLLYSDGQVKIADFGLSKEIGKPGYTNNTNYVSTRWYRAPEVILRSTTYDGKIDIFSLGCIIAEMYSGDPLLPGSSETDMLFRLANLIG
jgi:serine/threonine protein kinase